MGELQELEADINRLRSEKQALEAEINELQTVIGFNEEMLEADGEGIFTTIEEDPTSDDAAGGPRRRRHHRPSDPLRQPRHRTPNSAAATRGEHRRRAGRTRLRSGRRCWPPRRGSGRLTQAAFAPSIVRREVRSRNSVVDEVDFDDIGGLNQRFGQLLDPAACRRTIDTDRRLYLAVHSILDGRADSAHPL